MKLVRSNRWLLLGAVVLLTPMLLSAKPKPKKGCGDDSFHGDRNCQQVPEGGTSAGYLLALGATCLGAMLIRSHSEN